MDNFIYGESCNCSMHASAGDMGPCMWECPVHKIGCFIGVKMVIQKHLGLFLTEARATRVAYIFLKKKQKEFKDKGSIYFDEDFFTNDLDEYFMQLGKTYEGRRI